MGPRASAYRFCFAPCALPLRRRADGRNDVETSMLEESLERRFRLAALRSERGELYHLRATRQISNETLQKLLHDLDLLEALLIEDQ